MYGIPVQDAIGDDYVYSIESSFEQKRGAPLMKPPKDALPDRKPTRRDRVKKALRTEAILAQSVALAADFLDKDTEQAQEAVDIPQNVAEILLDRFMDDLHSMALPEADNPTLL